MPSGASWKLQQEESENSEKGAKEDLAARALGESSQQYSQLSRQIAGVEKKLRDMTRKLDVGRAITEYKRLLSLPSMAELEPLNAPHALNRSFKDFPRLCPLNEGSGEPLVDPGCPPLPGAPGAGECLPCLRASLMSRPM